jgi:hypothetical protein
MKDQSDSLKANELKPVLSIAVKQLSSKCTLKPKNNKVKMV